MCTRSIRLGLVLPLLSLATVACSQSPPATLSSVAKPDTPTHYPASAAVRGWNILSDSDADAEVVIAAAPAYDINHLQLSHHIVHDLRHVREAPRREQANRLTRLAHEAGIEEVVVWDRALYALDYYPQRFRTGPDHTIDLDNTEFWDWLKQDYREMLNLVPNIDGLILTFIETGAYVEEQHSVEMTTNSEKLAAVINAVADVVIGERGLTIYARTFSYTHEEYQDIVGAIDLFKYPQIKLMMKESPHDFLLLHPNNKFAGQFDRPTIIEFDPAAEFNGHGDIANTWPQYILERWRDYEKRPNIVGYVARTDRYGDTRIVGRPSEINLLALQRAAQNPDVTPDAIYDEFITQRYGPDALPHLKPAFKNAFDIVTASLYTLGANTANHSSLNLAPYLSNYDRHVSGKWLDPPIAHVEHGINRSLHYWTDVIDKLAPAWAKQPTPRLKNELPHVLAEGWLTPEEQITEPFLDMILMQKDYGVALAQESLRQIEAARNVLKPQDYTDLHHHFTRTLLTAQLHRAVAAMYHGFRVYARGEDFRTPSLMATVRDGLIQTREIGQQILDYPVKPPVGQWDWARDPLRAMLYYNWIVSEGWPAETQNHPNAHAGLTFPLDEK